jgi:hypothetical protein
LAEPAVRIVAAISDAPRRAWGKARQVPLRDEGEVRGGERP